ncbi:hypothetical protein ABZ922_43040 [Streptomyces shenzhenensis]|uniref:hypothetical protein n=1 Tax=Streptomyces shenzhenensis TaxID=943815 RepID=UPI0033FF9F2F
MSGEITAGLRRDAIGLREILFQSITAMASAAAVAASIPSGAAFAGGSLPLSVLIALVACVFTASRANVSTCTFAPARVRVRPGFLARLHPRYRSPGAGIAVLSTAGIPEFGFKTEVTAPMSYAGPVVGAWTAAGVVVLVILIRRHPERIADRARVHLGEPVPAGPGRMELQSDDRPASPDAAASTGRVRLDVRWRWARHWCPTHTAATWTHPRCAPVSPATSG